MARTHSKKTVILIGSYDVSGHCTDSTCERNSGTEDNTVYGKNSVVKDPTLLDGVFTCGGKYDDTVNGPSVNLLPLIGTKQTIKYRPEGTGSGLPQRTFSAVLTKFNESAPVAGYRVWSLETEPSDDWDYTPQ